MSSEDVSGARGSSQIGSAFEEGGTLEYSDFAWLEELIRNDSEIELLNFWVYGQPAIDRVGGLLWVSRPALPRVVERFADRHPVPFRLDFFNRASPNPDHIGVGFSGTWGPGQPSVETLRKS